MDAVQPAMSDEYQILIPPSFHLLHADPRGRLTVPLAVFRARYELCEDMAQMLVERALSLQHELGLADDLIFSRMHVALGSPEAGFSAGEAAWVVARLAELLAWDAGRAAVAS